MEELRIQGLKKKIADFTLAADFKVGAGERVGLMGPSGCGKTSLLRQIAGLDRDPRDEGRTFLGSDDITAWAPGQRRVGMIFQDPMLFPALNVLENAAFGLRMHGVSKADREAQALSWLEKLGLRSRASAAVDTLSGGEKQRVAFVRAIVWKPRVLLLDEPFSALDAGLRSVLRRELVELHQLWPVPLLLVTHDQDDLDAVATRRLGFGESGGIRMVE